MWELTGVEAFPSALASVALRFLNINTLINNVFVALTCGKRHQRRPRVFVLHQTVISSCAPLNTQPSITFKTVEDEIFECLNELYNNKN